MLYVVYDFHLESDSFDAPTLGTANAQDIFKARHMAHTARKDWTRDCVLRSIGWDKSCLLHVTKGVFVPSPSRAANPRRVRVAAVRGFAVSPSHSIPQAPFHLGYLISFCPSSNALCRRWTVQLCMSLLAWLSFPFFDWTAGKTCRPTALSGWQLGSAIGKWVRQKRGDRSPARGSPLHIPDSPPPLPMVAEMTVLGLCAGCNGTTHQRNGSSSVLFDLSCMNHHENSGGETERERSG